MNKLVLKEYITSLESYSKIIDKLIKIGFDIESAIIQDMFSQMASLVSIGESLWGLQENEWISYFIYECEFGHHPMEVTIPEDKEPIEVPSSITYTLNSIDAFVELVGELNHE